MKRSIAQTSSTARSARPYEIIVIGSSLGGLRALQVLLGCLSAGFPLPLVIAQHRAKQSYAALGAQLQRHCALAVNEPEDKENILPGRVYLAPSDYHLLLQTDGFAISTEAPVHHARPSIDVLFESAADVYGEKAIGVILTGAGLDGAQGLSRIKTVGGLTLVQDPATAECPTLPRAALAATAADWVLPLADIAPFLNKLCALEEGKYHAA